MHSFHRLASVFYTKESETSIITGPHCAGVGKSMITSEAACMAAADALGFKRWVRRYFFVLMRFQWWSDASREVLVQRNIAHDSVACRWFTWPMLCRDLTAWDHLFAEGRSGLGNQVLLDVTFSKITKMSISTKTLPRPESTETITWSANPNTVCIWPTWR